MNKSEYYNLREHLAIKTQLGSFYKMIYEILDSYPAFKSMTLEEAEKWFCDKNNEYENRIQKLLNVE